jgi:hypothetical protein
MSHLGFPATHESPLGDVLRVIRLGHNVSRRIGDRWIHVSVRTRAERHARDLARVERQSWHPKRWQPPEGRESPREEWMAWRRSFTQYAYAGWMRHWRGKAPALVGRELLYCPRSPRAHYAHPPRNT